MCPIDYQKLTEASLRLKITDLERARRYELEQLYYAIDLLDECGDFLHADSQLNKRIRLFLDGTIDHVAQCAQLTNGDNNAL